MNLEEALDVINELGLGLGKTYSKDFELKGYKIDREDGGSCKFYLQASEIQQLAEAFSTIAAIATGGDAIQYPLESDPRVIELIAQERKRLANLCNAIAKELAGDPACIGAMRCVSKIRGEK